MSSSVSAVVTKFYDDYLKTTPTKLKLIDAYLLYVLMTGIVQFVYCCLVGTFPFNSFLSGFISCVGSFVLGGKCFACPKLHIWSNALRDLYDPLHGAANLLLFKKSLNSFLSYLQPASDFKSTLPTRASSPRLVQREPSQISFLHTWFFI